MFTPKFRTYLVLGATGFFCLPVAAQYMAKTQSNWQAADARNAQNQVTAQNADIAADRAQSCVLLDSDTPLSDVGVAHYRGQPNRFLPAGSIICDQYGNTAVVGRAGAVYDLRSGPAERINQIIQTRGKTPASPGPIESNRRNQ